MFLFDILVNNILTEEYSPDARIVKYNDLKKIAEIEIEKSKKQNFINPEVYDILRHMSVDIFRLKQQNRSTDIIPEIEKIYLEVRTLLKVATRIIRLRNILSMFGTENHKKAINAFNYLKLELVDGIEDEELINLTTEINDKISEKIKQNQEYKQQIKQEKEEALQQRKQQREQRRQERYIPKLTRQQKSLIAAQKALEEIKNRQPKPPKEKKPSKEKKPQFPPKLTRQQIIQRSLDRINNR